MNSERKGAIVCACGCVHVLECMVVECCEFVCPASAVCAYLYLCAYRVLGCVLPSRHAFCKFDTHVGTLVAADPRSAVGTSVSTLVTTVED